MTKSISKLPKDLNNFFEKRAHDVRMRQAPGETPYTIQDEVRKALYEFMAAKSAR